MKAVMMTAVGGPEVLALKDVPEPVLTAPDQVKVRLRAAGINPIDTKLRARGLLVPDALPHILGCDGAGEVVEIGADVRHLAVGDAVWYCHGGLGREPGNYAEYNVVPAAVARRAPAGIDAFHAAAGPLVLITAWEALFDRARLQADRTVLVHAGAGGVGHVAIQLARWAGARVGTTVSSPGNAEFVRSLGAERVIDYRGEDFVAAVNDWTDGRGVDVVLDCVGGETFRRSLEAAAHYGDVVTLLEPGADVVWKEARNRNLRIGFELMLTPMLRDLPQARARQGEILDRCAVLIDGGELRLQVAARLPLAAAAEAHARIQEGHVQGKLVLDIGG
ncbi:MAG: zinc-binding dehydrogenase [Pseudomonadota bacterium]